MYKNLTNLTVIVLSIFMSVSSLSAQTFNYLGTFNSNGVPNYLTAPGDVLSTAFLGRISNSLPEYYPVPQYHPEYLTSNIDTEVKLTDSADVFMTFVDEGAGYKNAMAFYTYKTATPLTVKPSAVTVIFPNLSLPGSGGNLARGSKVKLGRFPGGTSIGFALIADGFRNGAVTSGNHILYSNPNFNPESDPTLRRHNVLLRDSAGIVVLGFEDLRRDNSGCDNDFNDAVVYLTATPLRATAGGVINGTIGGTGAVGSGNNGGLESDGCLAGAIAIRNFKRAKTPSVSFDNTEKLVRFSEPMGGLTTRGDVELEQFIPQKPFPVETPATAFMTSPKDLIGITNAQKVLSVDYFDDVTNERVAAVLTLKTGDKVYDHTKVVCDRLTGSTLLRTEVVTINNMPFIRATLQREDGTFEYAISFVANQDDATSATITSRWAIDDYPTKAGFWNYQVWAEAPHLTQRVVEQILAKLMVKFPNLTSATAPIAPQLFVKKGNYENGNLNLTIYNPLKANFLTLKGNLTSSETSERTSFTQNVTLDGSEEQNIQVYVGNIFDLGFTIRNNKSSDYDALYLADGAWGVEYDRNISKVEKFDVNNTVAPKESGVQNLERNPTLNGTVKDYVSLFRSLRPAGAAADMSKFKNIVFTASGTGVVEVTLVKKSVTDWAKQYRAEVRLFNEKQNYRLNVADFSNGTNEPLNMSDLVDVAFTIKGDGKTEKAFDLSVENLAFDNKKAAKIAVLEGSLSVFPNPTSEQANIEFDLTERSAAIVTISNAQGQIILQKNEEFAKGRNRMALNLSTVAAGVYIASVQTNKGVMIAKVIVNK